MKLPETLFLMSGQFDGSGRDVRDNQDASRFELEIEGDVVFANYRRQPDRVLITHVEAPMRLRGKGAAARLMNEIAIDARQTGVKLAPLCSYAAAWFRRNRSFADVLA
jgi:predicted GNAT family acetyltransferase